MKKKTEDKIIELRNKDLGYKTIAKQLGLKKGQVRYICLKNGLGGKKAKQVNQFGTLQERKQKFIKEFENKFPDFEYHSDFKDIDSNFKMKCKICGYIQERNAQCVRPSRDKELQCDNCNRIRLERKKEQEQRMKELGIKKEKIISQKRRELNKLYRIIRNHRYYIKCDRCGKYFFTNRKDIVNCNNCIKAMSEEEKAKKKMWKGKIIKCNECGKEFEMITSRSKYCSQKCQDKAHNRRKELKRRRRLLKNGKVNYNINLDKLIERDKGICQICDEPIDTSDFEITDEGYFIAGNNYPSIDHIVPVAKGGTHTWNNVQLAHRHCNSIKNDRIDFEVKEVI